MVQDNKLEPDPHTPQVMEYVWLVAIVLLSIYGGLVVVGGVWTPK